MNQRKVRIGGGAPTRAELFASITADVMSQDELRSRAFYECFTPSPAQQEVFDTIENSQAPEGAWLHVMLEGDTGGGKTWTALGYAIKCMMEYPGCRILLVRETAGAIRATTFREVLRFFTIWGINVAHKNETLGTLEIENGSMMFFCSDKALLKQGTTKNKSDYLGSSEFSIAIFEEADSTSEEVYRTVSGRMRQDVGVKRSVIFAVTNPPSPYHWLYKLYDRPDRMDQPKETRRWHKFKMMGADNPFAKKGYQEAKMQDWDDDESTMRRLGLGQSGPETRGTPYFHRSFSADLHVSSLDLRSGWKKGVAMWRGWDFGYNFPALVVLQDDPDRGQIRVLHSILEQEMSTWQMMETWLPRLNELYPGANWRDACDRQGNVKQSSTGWSDIDVMNSFGVYPVHNYSLVEYGLSIIDKQLNKLAYRGEPSLLFDARCKDLVDSISMGYCVKRDNTTGQLVINKDGIYDHIMDAFRYVIVQIRDPKWEYRPWESRRQEWAPMMDREQSRQFYKVDGHGALPATLNPSGHTGIPQMQQATYVRGAARRRY